MTRQQRIQMKNQIALFLVASVLGTAVATAQDKINDVIQTTQGQRIRGVEVTATTSKTISYTKGEESSDLPATRLLDIVWSDPPEEYALARAALRNADFATAANMFTEAANKTKREPLEAECRYQAAAALVRGAGTDTAKSQEAVKSLNDWLAKWPDGYRAPDAQLMLGRAYVAAGDPAQAQTTFKKLSDDTLKNGWAPIWNARARFELARALLAAGDFDGARNAFRAASSAADTAAGQDGSSEEIVSLRADAAVGIGETMVREGKFEDALAYFQDLVHQAKSDAIRAAAKAGQGEALFLKAQKAGTVDGLREAQIALAEAGMLDSTAGETTAKALYYSGEVLLALGPDHEASTYKQRAADYFQSVVKNFPNTVWAPKAAEAARQ